VLPPSLTPTPSQTVSPLTDEVSSQTPPPLADVPPLPSEESQVLLFVCLLFIADAVMKMFLYKFFQATTFA
jgi:hypothetical protein